ncbi:MAG: hypothetical protein KF845_13645 [Cyclobacteriaceae bacterium]|nr:hypothetical protein [Cyclobacteriaceae bacterium]
MRRGRKEVAVECKLSKAPVVARGFYYLLGDLKIKEAYVVCPIAGSFSLSKGVTAIGVAGLIEKLR